MKKSLCLAVLSLSFITLAQAQIRPTTNVTAPAPVVATAAPATPAVQLDLGLEHMSLTAAQIRKRDKLLKPIYDNYRNVNLSSVANALEKAYGMNIYSYVEGQTPALSDKKGVMANAVLFYMTGTGEFSSAADTVIPFRAGVRLTKCGDYYGCRNGMVEVTGKKIAGGDRFGGTTSIYSPSILASSVSEYQNDFLGMFNTSVSRAMYTTTQDPLFSAPVMSDFLEAMKNLNLRGLDATVNFTPGDLSTGATQVVYPHFSKIAPIPQPVIFISKNASYQEIEDTLRAHAPRIYAYNKLFNASVLPSVKDINDLLAKYPNILAEVQKVRGNVSRQNLINAIQGAFLNVTYGVGAGLVGAAALLTAPVSIFVVASSPLLAPVFISNIIIFL